MHILCFSMAMTPINSINTMAISAMGRSGVYLVLDIVKKVSGIILMLISIRYGIMTFVVVMAFVQDPLGVFVNSFTTGKLLKYSFPMQMRDIAPTGGLCAVSAVAMWGGCLALEPVCSALPNQNLAYAVTLVANCCIGFGLYFALAYAFRLRPLAEYCNILLPVMRKHFPKLAERISAVDWER